jgi:hypothetical protein
MVHEQNVKLTGLALALPGKVGRHVVKLNACEIQVFG